MVRKFLALLRRRCTSEETERKLEVFGRQNNTLSVKKWVVFHRGEKQDGTLLVIAVDNFSMFSLTKGIAFHVSNAVRLKKNKVRIVAD